MATTTNYAWTTPDNSGLVKNGAQDIRTLGSAVDTSLWNVGFGQAGKNKIINGDFGIWQRGTNFTQTGTGIFTADRWDVAYAGATGSTVSRYSMTVGELQNFICGANVEGTLTDSINGYILFRQKIENVNTFANRTVSVSFWAKGSINGTIGIRTSQNFGTGGSPSSNVDISQTQAITTNWVRYSLTYNLASVSGKTLGSNNNSLLAINFDKNIGSGISIGYGTNPNFTGTLSITGVQVEYGSVATPFQTATGTLAGELAACQRYYYLAASGTSQAICNGYYYSAAEVDGVIQFPVTMRTTPTLDQVTGTDYYQFIRNGGGDGFNSFSLSYGSTKAANIYNGAQVSGTAGQAGHIASNNASAYLAFSAEL